MASCQNPSGTIAHANTRIVDEEHALGKRVAHDQNRKGRVHEGPTRNLVEFHA